MVKISNTYKFNSIQSIFPLDKFILAFYTIYLIISILGYFLIRYIPINFNTIFFYFLYVLLFAFGSFIGVNSKTIIIRKVLICKFERIAFIMLLVSIVLVLFSWLRIIKYYGSLKYIFLQALVIRQSSIGGQVSIIPVFVGYGQSLVYALYVIFLVFYEKTQKNKYILYSIIVFVLIVLIDLTMFGRIGIIYGIFCTIGYFIFFKKKLITKKSLLLFSVLYIVLGLPRLIRGGFDNFKGTVNQYLPYFRFNIPPFFYSFISIFVYFFGSIFALNEFLINPSELTYGKRLFTPIYNLFSRFLLHEDRINLIDIPANIPFNYNIFTIIKDIISDFGTIGLIIVPFSIGVFFGLIFRKQGFFSDALKIYIIAWILYSPMYNAFSFGGFFFSFVFLLFLSILFNYKPLEIKK